MLFRFDPIRELERLADPSVGQQRPETAALDAYRHGDEFRVTLDLPGVDPDAIELIVERNVLTIKATRSRDLPQGAEVLVAERATGDTVRRLILGKDVDTERIVASYDAGVLQLALPLVERSKPRRVEVVVGSSAKSVPQPSGPTGDGVPEGTDSLGSRGEGELLTSAA